MHDHPTLSDRTSGHANPPQPITAPGHGPAASTHAPAPDHRVIRRNGQVTAFDAGKISVALTKAFLAVEGGSAAASTRIHETVSRLTTQVAQALWRHADATHPIHIEDIQDQVELALMRGGHHKVARAYVLYREEHARARTAETPAAAPSPDTS